MNFPLHLLIAPGAWKMLLKSLKLQLLPVPVLPGHFEGGVILPREIMWNEGMHIQVAASHFDDRLPTFYRFSILGHVQILTILMLGRWISVSKCLTPSIVYSQDQGWSWSCWWWWWSSDSSGLFVIIGFQNHNINISIARFMSILYTIYTILHIHV